MRGSAEAESARVPVRARKARRVKVGFMVLG